MAIFTTQQISDQVDGTLTGPADLRISGVEQIQLASPNQITFVGDKIHAVAWSASRAAAALVSNGINLDDDDERTLIRVRDADLAMMRVLTMFAPDPSRPKPGIAPNADVDSTAQLGDNVAIGAGCFVGQRVRLGDGTVLHPHVTVMDDCVIGSGCVIWPGTVIRERCEIGERCELHPNTTIGADGFGYRPDANGNMVKIPHIGNVRIGNAVEIGAGTCIDRGKFSATIVDDNTKIDNLCQIAHNCRIGKGCVIAGMSALAGSVTVGDRVVIGGKVAVKDHVTIGDGATLAGNASLMNDLPGGETWAGYPAQSKAQALREHLAVRKLPDLIKMLNQK